MNQGQVITREEFHKEIQELKREIIAHGGINGDWNKIRRSLVVSFVGIVITVAGVGITAWTKQQVLQAQITDVKTKLDATPSEDLLQAHMQMPTHPGAVGRQEYNSLMSRLDRLEEKLDRALAIRNGQQ